MINLNFPQKLSTQVLKYTLTSSVLIFLVLFIILYFIPVKSFHIAGINVSILAVYWILFFIVIISTFLYWNSYRYTISADSISILSGILFTSEKNVNFNDIQNFQVSKGPLISLFGVRRIAGFTSSPGQLIITSTKEGGVSTQQRPDINMYLDTQTAEEVSQMIKKGDIQKVQNVA